MTKPRQSILSELLITPDPAVTSDQILFSRRKGGVFIAYSSDGGKTFTDLVPVPSRKTSRKGQVLTLDENLAATWKLPEPPERGYFSNSFIPFGLVGDLVAGTTFGLFVAPFDQGATAESLQASIQDVADQDVIIDFINGSGTEQNRRLTIKAGNKTASVRFSTPLIMGAGTNWQMKIIQAGTSSARGQNINALAGIKTI